MISTKATPIRWKNVSDHVRKAEPAAMAEQLDREIGQGAVLDLYRRVQQLFGAWRRRARVILAWLLHFAHGATMRP